MGIKSAASDFIIECVRDVATAKAVFTSDDVWSAFERRGGHRFPIEKRAMGPAMLRAVKEGICLKLDKVVKSNRRSQGLSQCYRSALIERSKEDRVAELLAEIASLSDTLSKREAEVRCLLSQ